MDESSSNSAPQIGAPAQKSREAQALARVIEALEGLEPVARKRVLQTASVFYAAESLPEREHGHSHSSARHHSEPTPIASFAEDRTPSPKEFLLTKKPSTDVDRVTCLAYYLTHFKNTPHFKTLDLSKLNTEAAQIKFSNAAAAVDNATKAGLLVSAARGNKQISAAGELYIQALPDRLAARAAIEHFRPRRKGRKANSTGETAE
ncbi:MAG TPA: hypothetical protein VK539_02205 [Myxococcaceae bacterium]|nr:hypothetical protein [Myxococcaceae bacterium]